MEVSYWICSDKCYLLKIVCGDNAGLNLVFFKIGKTQHNAR